MWAQSGGVEKRWRGGTATRRQAKRRESSRSWYGGLAGDEINPDCSYWAGSVHRDPLDSRLADRLEEAYRWLRAV